MSSGLTVFPQEGGKYSFPKNHVSSKLSTDQGLQKYYHMFLWSVEH